ncbi:MAG: hypothetical protein H7259_06365 [Cytophagales bacterium]|nr:hypothetical protein [Cytophaga sp.]
MFIILIRYVSLVRPDFKQYDYFDYSVHEALFLSDKEETTISGVLKNIQQEYHSNIDTFSKDVMIVQLELLLKYAERFHKVLERLEELLADYFNSEALREQGLPRRTIYCRSIIDVAQLFK